MISRNYYPDMWKWHMHLQNSATVWECAYMQNVIYNSNCWRKAEKVQAKWRKCSGPGWGEGRMKGRLRGLARAKTQGKDWKCHSEWTHVLQSTGVGNGELRSWRVGDFGAKQRGWASFRMMLRLTSSQSMKPSYLHPCFVGRGLIL